jgi:hypothetical protein
MTSESTRFDTVLFGVRLACTAWLLAVGLWSAPAWGATLAWPNGLLAVEVVLAVALLLLARRGQVRADYPFLLPGLAALAVGALAAALRGTPLDMRLWQLSEPMLRGALLYYAIAGQPRVARVAWIAALAGVALPALATIVQHATGVTRWFPDLDTGWAGGWAPVLGPRAQGLTSYINLTAATMAAGIALWAVPPILRLPAVMWQRVALLAAAMATVAAAWYTNSRGPIMAAAITACAFFGLRSPRFGRRVLVLLGCFLLGVWPRVPWWALLAFLAGAGLSVVVLAQQRVRALFPVAVGLALAGGLLALDHYVLHQNYRLRLSEQGINDVARLAIYHAVTTLVPTAPLWGVGDAAVAAHLHASPDPRLNELPRTQRNAHNQYLHWVVAEGLPAALLYTGLVVWATVWLWRAALGWPAPDPQARGLAIAAALTIFLLANLVDAHFWRSEGAGFFFSLLGLGAALRPSPPPPIEGGCG